MLAPQTALDQLDTNNMKITKAYLNKIIKEEMSKTLKEVLNPPIGSDLHYTANISAMNFLRLTTPYKETKEYTTFIKELRKNKIKDIEGVKSYFDSLPAVDSVSRNVIGRAVKNYNNPEFINSGKSFLSLVLQNFPSVINHEGRARAFRSILENYLSGKGKPEEAIINILITVDGKSLETLESLLKAVSERLHDMLLQGQKLGGMPSNSIPVLNLFSDVKRA